MEKLLKKLGILYESVQMLFLMEKISRGVRDHMAATIGDMEFLLKRATDDEVEKISGFSQSEEFVNKHVNLADTATIIGELRRRGYLVDLTRKNDDTEESASN